MDELIRQALTILRGMWHRRWIGLAAAWLAAIIAVSVVLRIPERYEASARVYVDTQSLLRPLMEGLSIQPNLDQQVAMISRTLISRPNIEKLIRMADLDLSTNSVQGRDELIDSVTRSLQLTGSGSNNLYVISYRDSDAGRARKLVQSLLAIFVESSLGDKRQDTRTAVKFLDEQIKQYESSLKTAEDRLKQFRLKYLGVTGNQDYFGRLEKLGADLNNAKLELRAAEQSRDSYKRELAGEAPVLLPENPAAAVPVAVPELDARLASLKTQLDTLLRQYTEEHPDVVGTKRIISQLEEQRKQELEAMRKTAAASARPVDPADRNPVFQQLKFSLAEAEANVASLRAKVSSYEAQYAQLKSAARLVPQVEADFAQLNRDYDVQKKTYETLLARRQSATIGEGVQDAGGAQIRVIDPPRVSPQPIPPTRVMLMGLALLASLAIGLLVSFIAAEVMPTFHDARSVNEVTKRPILGMVTMFPSMALTRARKRSAFLFATGATGLFASFVAVFAFVLLMGRVA